MAGTGILSVTAVFNTYKGKNHSGKRKMLGNGYLLMPRPASFAVIVLLRLFSQFSFCEQPTVANTAAMSGLRDSVKGVFTEGFTYGYTTPKGL
jgi:hypothetical protein